ncbi:MAG TPA: DegV family protein [Syntrophomonas sp.]|nr:DegV family protein [Syntrophomonas sp.]HRW12964.1 DegV family protein [Syntrophomonas sp.]
MAIKVISDSTSYIDPDTQKELDIELIPLSVNFPDEQFLETEVDYDYFYNKIEQTGVIPTSSQPSLGDIIEKFREIAAHGDDILAIFISSAMSGTYETALKAREKVLQEFPQVQIDIMDSYTNCMALGMQVVAAAREIKQGASLHTALQAAQYVRERVRFYFVPETLKYLKKGGRIGTASALLGTILNIRPILTVDMKTGMTHLMEKTRGTSAAIKRMLKFLEEDWEKYGLREILIHHINAPEKAENLRDMLMERYDMQVDIRSIGPVIGLHTGLGTVGFVYCTEK